MDKNESNNRNLMILTNELDLEMIAPSIVFSQLGILATLFRISLFSSMSTNELEKISINYVLFITPL